MIRVADPGLLTTVQDAGRWGCQHLGVPVAGPMDPLSHRAANLLVGNPADRAALEVTLVGPEIEFLDDAVFAVAGARFDLRFDGKPMRTGVAARAARGAACVSAGARRARAPTWRCAGASTCRRGSAAGAPTSPAASAASAAGR